MQCSRTYSTRIAANSEMTSAMNTIITKCTISLHPVLKSQDISAVLYQVYRFGFGRPIRRHPYRDITSKATWIVGKCWVRRVKFWNLENLVDRPEIHGHTVTGCQWCSCVDRDDERDDVKKQYFWNGPVSTHPLPVPAGIQFTPLGSAMVQLWASKMPFPLIDVSLPSNIGELTGSSAYLPQFQYCLSF